MRIDDYDLSKALEVSVIEGQEIRQAMDFHRRYQASVVNLLTSHLILENDSSSFRKDLGIIRKEQKQGSEITNLLAVSSIGKPRPL